MIKITNFKEVEAVLSAYVRPANEPGGYKLDRMQQLMGYLGNPQDSYKVIHVAGTSGKTSTCYYAAAMLQAAGYKVGHTVSPHVDQVNERAQINLRPLGEREYCRQLARFLELIQPSGVMPSYFELLVAFAYWLFAEQKVEYAVIEVGLGGLLDGTNVVHSPNKICVITDIGLDHTHILGNTVEEIAAQKAGIIHAHNHVFMHTQSANIVQVFRSRSDAQAATLHVLQPQTSDAMTSGLPLFQQRNWQLAAAVVNYALGSQGHSKLTPEELRSTLTTYIPARMEVLRYKDQTIIMDGSHNEQKIGALVASLQEKYPGRRFKLLVSFGQNKSESVEASLRILAGLGTSIILTEFSITQDHPRQAIAASRLRTLALEAGFDDAQAMPDAATALTQLLTQPEDLLLITGSFYLLNHIRPLLKQ